VGPVATSAPSPGGKTPTAWRIVLGKSCTVSTPRWQYSTARRITFSISRTLPGQG
jgi:hypothetical protein